MDPGSRGRTGHHGHRGAEQWEAQEWVRAPWAWHSKNSPTAGTAPKGTFLLLFLSPGLGPTRAQGSG